MISLYIRLGGYSALALGHLSRALFRAGMLILAHLRSVLTRGYILPRGFWVFFALFFAVNELRWLARNEDWTAVVDILVLTYWAGVLGDAWFDWRQA